MLGMVGERVCIDIDDASWNVRESEGMEMDCEYPWLEDILLGDGERV